MFSLLKCLFCFSSLPWWNLMKFVQNKVFIITSQSSCQWSDLLPPHWWQCLVYQYQQLLWPNSTTFTWHTSQIVDVSHKNMRNMSKLTGGVTANIIWSGSLFFCLRMFCFSPPNGVPVLVKLRVVGSMGSCVTTYTIKLSRPASSFPLQRRLWVFAGQGYHHIDLINHIVQTHIAA